MLVKTYTAALVSVDAHLVTVEVNVEPGAAVTLVGLPDTSVKERVTSALRRLPSTRATVCMASEV